ncbi:two-component sensor histidine kinase [Sphaerisporangium krabiense]|uniref:histidine kinase n=1 Tax=Sphaerisporangium krabiense TaxID=763782 RepID=A0A7W8Z0S1_9ACTN|nr:histidine kinase [Sphaerisporangium krabiense]MBB5625265.1 signal transduction histidine kinase [Sphaerisporangium krabiense]GII64219.1 two-component sensor histidine kinase [Sphaerisporangium krabiense]
MTMTRLRDVRLIPLAFGPLIAFLAILETRLDDSFGASATATWISGVALGLGVVVAARHPLAGTAIAAACLPVAVVAFDAPGVGGAAMIGLIGVVAWTGWREPPRRSAIALCVAGVSFACMSIAAGGTLWELFFVPAVLLPGWFMGLLARRSGERAVKLAELAAALDAEREANAQAAVAQERTRIAREVHDAVAHSVSVITLQLGGLRRMLADRPVELEVVAGLEQLGRQTVEEMRGLVGILRERVDGERPTPAPSLARVGELISDVRAAGLDVTLNSPAEPPRLPPVLDLTAYRVLQEALTNVLRHAGRVPTVVTIDYTAQALTLEVRNDPAPEPAAIRLGGEVRHEAGTTPRRGGHGLVGMRERLAMVRGTLHAAPEPDGGFAVRARFPIPRVW